VTRSLRVAALVLAIAAAAPAATPAEGSQAASVRVYFLQGEQLVAVTRPGSTVKAAVTALLAGPARAETAKQFPTYVPSGTRLRSVRFANGVATVDLGERFAAGRDAESLSARITQLVYTVASVPGVKSVRLLVSGGVPLGLFPGYALSRPVTRAQATRPIVPPPTAPPGEGGQPNPETRALQQRLADLGFLALSAVDGVAGEQTRFAVIAFQKWARLARDGVAGPQTKAALAQAGRPSPLRSGGGGRRVEVLLDRQLALAIENNTVVRAIHVSTGAPGYGIPAGSCSVFRKEVRSWSVPFKVWLPWASYVVGGIAFHEYPDVPVVPASHGASGRPATTPSGRTTSRRSGRRSRSSPARESPARNGHRARARRRRLGRRTAGDRRAGRSHRRVEPSEPRVPGRRRAAEQDGRRRPGLEIDFARSLAARLGLKRVRFVNDPSFKRMLARGRKPWDLALAEVTITAARRQNVDLSQPYLRAEQGVLVRKGLTAPRTLAALARLRICLQRGTTSVAIVRERVRPSQALLFFASLDLLLEGVRSGRCEAAVLDAPILAAERAAAPYRYGVLAGVLRTDERYGVVLQKGSQLTRRVNAAVRALVANGTLARLQRRWLLTDLGSLRVLG
jgi:ABC-type amino acid transport substrate-binding protein